MILRSTKIQNFLIFLLTEFIRYKYTHIKMYAFIDLLCFLSFLVVIVLFVSLDLFRARSTNVKNEIHHAHEPIVLSTLSPDSNETFSISCFSLFCRPFCSYKFHYFHLLNHLNLKIVINFVSCA